ncbi:hypothetical protein ACELLULO517_23235 [Acidisoma cellulosilytica]|uniref:Uncharacterized protein n=1 Tax=Acidisoma cellulosilyticum TaxID=2802395 RepID=A0A963Z7A5_9PROT|nr:hypothetical protein [Acidisoma cellulosilyticum]MCB8883182.1 hypothetical protein [Acidisoma cellulosilyticum]
MTRPVLSEAEIRGLALRAGLEPTEGRLAELAEGARHLAVMLTDLDRDLDRSVESAVIFSAERSR